MKDYSISMHSKNSGIKIRDLKVDGGPAKNNYLMQSKKISGMER
jgi:glycerol kinase